MFLCFFHVDVLHHLLQEFLQGLLKGADFFRDGGFSCEVGLFLILGFVLFDYLLDLVEIF